MQNIVQTYCFLHPLVVAFWPFGSTQGPVAAGENTDFSQEELYEYVLDNIEDFDADMILDLAGDVRLDLPLPDLGADSEEIDAVIDELLDEMDPYSVSEFF